MSRPPTEKWIANLQAVMETLDDLEVTERQRTTIRQACAQAIVSAEDGLQFDYEHRNSSNKWGQNDIGLLESTLKDAQPCLSWADEKTILESLVQRLGRPEKIIKKKAIELGHGRKVDYWANRIAKD